MTQITREDYVIHNRITHNEYYDSVVKAAGINLEGSSLMPRVLKALEAGDDNLNNIPLKEWDAIACNPIYKAKISKALLEHNDRWCLGIAVCVLKRAARLAADKNKAAQKQYRELVNN
jgi:hypothetical protein